MKPEHLAVWYFRLNGFFTIPNFVLHPTGRGSALTNADIAGVRFPYRAEFPEGPGGDDAEFTRIVRSPYAVFAEVKTGKRSLNGPWTDSEPVGTAAGEAAEPPSPWRGCSGARGSSAGLRPAMISDILM